MSIRDRSLRVASLAAYLFGAAAFAQQAPSAWDGSPVGQCVSKYTVPKPTEDYPVVVKIEKNTDVQKNKYVWTWDPTTEKNPTRQLVRVTPRKVGCTILFLPFSEFNDFKLTADGNLPEQVTSTMATVNSEQGSYFFEHAYRLDKQTGYYEKMPTCYKVMVNGKRKEKINCESSSE